MSHAKNDTFDASSVQLPASSKLRGLMIFGFIIGVIGTGVTIMMRESHPAQVAFSWLTAYAFWLSIALGALFFVIGHYITKAGWSVVVRRIAENMTLAIPALIPAFLLVWFGRHELYHWMDAEAVAHDPLLQAKTWFLSENNFLYGTLICFAVWTWIAWRNYRRSTLQDQTGDAELTRKSQNGAPGSLIVFALSVTFAALMWIMSLDAHWYSTMFGVYFFAGAILSCYAFMTLVIVLLRRKNYMGGAVSGEHMHDMGKLLFAFTVFWAYIGFSQYFLIWYANIPEETMYFLHRFEGNWLIVARVLVAGHFVVPFLVLMPRAIKRTMPFLLFFSVWILAFHYLDLYWNIMANLHHEPHFSWADLSSFIGVGGFFLAGFGWALRRAALVPVKDPRLPESLHFQNV